METSLHNSDFQHVRDDSLPPSHLHDTDEANSSSLTLPLDGNRACLSASPASCVPPAAANTTFHVTDKTSHHRFLRPTRFPFFILAAFFIMEYTVKGALDRSR